MHILTLPITPKKTSSFTTLLTAFSAAILGLIHKAPVTIMLNTTGERIIRSRLTSEQAHGWYLEQLRGIGITNQDFCQILHDGSDGYDSYVQKVLPSLVPYLRDVTVQMGCCPCGIVEIPKKVFQDIGKKRKISTLVIRDRNGMALCKECCGEVRIVEQCALALQIQERPTFSVWPQIYTSECTATLNRIFDLPWYISRERRLSTRRYEIRGGVWGIDTDFRWMLYLRHILEEGEDRVLLVSALSTLNQALRVACVSRLFFPSLKINLLVHPHMRIKDEESKMSDMNIETFLHEANDVRCARLFLSLGLQWRHPDSMVRSSELHLVRTTLARQVGFEGSGIGMCRIQQNQDLNRLRILRLLKRLRSGKPLSEEDRCLYAVLIGAARPM